MQTAYIYSVSRVNSLAQFLLSKADIERLLVAKPGADLQSALKETYLAPYVVHVPEENVALAIEQTLIEAKRMIHQISPKGDMFRVLWVQYDIHNLRVFAKATVKGLTLAECQTYLSERGIYTPEKLHEHVEDGTLDSLQAGWQTVYNEAVQTIAEGGLDVVDRMFDELYFSTSLRIVEKVGDEFMKTYLANLIDLHNLKARLRYLKNSEMSGSPVFITGGTISADNMENIDAVVTAFARLGGAETWREALESYQSSGNFTQIDARAPEYLLTLTKEASHDMFSSASLVLYYLKCRQAAANVRSIVVGKNSGLNEAEIRANLRLSYVND